MRVSRPILAAATTFVVAFAVLTQAGEPARDPAPPPRLAAAPGDAGRFTIMAASFLRRARETGDAGAYRRAEGAIDRALASAPADAGALTERGALRLARHDFRGALRDGLRAHRLAPEAVKPYGVLVDAYLELGRYDRAAQTLQTMVDLKPDLAAYARVSYFRELHGDLPGAVEAMELAVSASGGAREDTAFAATGLGDLEFARGRLQASRRAYRQALAVRPRHIPARAAMARLRAASGRLEAAARELRAIVDERPLPEYVVALGETELAAGRPARAARDLALVRAQERLLRAGGVSTDVELAIFEASHGDPAKGVAIARRAWAAAPSVRSADALGWALTRAGRPRQALPWARRALALGSRDPLFLFHAGMAARGAGERRLARRRLARSLAGNPRFSALWAPRARRALETLR